MSHRFRTIVDIEQDRIEAFLLMFKEINHVTLVYASTAIFYRSSRTVPQRTSIPLHDCGNQFSHDYLGRLRDDSQYRRQREAHSKTTDEYSCVFDPA